MTRLAAIDVQMAPALRRLEAIGRLDEAARRALAEAMGHGYAVKPHRELLHEGAPIRQMLVVLSGWAARVRQLEDGRRQIISFVLPGDLIGNCRQAEPLAVSSVVALTQVEVCAAPSERVSPRLPEAYAISHAFEEAYLLAQITRLGRLSAEERIADLALELLDRLELCGLARGDGFALPLTQETLADATGLSCVHMNRTLQSLRRQGDLTFKGGYLAFSDPAELARRVGQSPPTVTAAASAFCFGRA